MLQYSLLQGAALSCVFAVSFTSTVSISPSHGANSVPPRPDTYQSTGHLQATRDGLEGEPTASTSVKHSSCQGRTGHGPGSTRQHRQADDGCHVLSRAVDLRYDGRDQAEGRSACQTVDECKGQDAFEAGGEMPGYDLKKTGDLE